MYFLFTLVEGAGEEGKFLKAPERGRKSLKAEEKSLLQLCPKMILIAIIRKLR